MATCGTCNRDVERTWTTHELCEDCYSIVPTMSVNRAEGKRRCAFSHFTWPRGAPGKPESSRKTRGIGYHDVLAIWASEQGSVEDAYRAILADQFDADGSILRVVKDLAGRFKLPPKDQILYADGAGGHTYPAAFRAFPTPGRPWLRRSFAVVVERPSGEVYIWIGSHDLVWIDKDGWIWLVDWKGGKEVDMSIMAPVYALSAFRIWRKLKPKGVKVQAIGVSAPWSSPVETFEAADLGELDSIAFDLSREYYGARDRGDWPATANQYCEECPRLARCPEINGSMAVEPRPMALLNVTLEEASTPVILEERELWPERRKHVEAFEAALYAEATKRLAEEGTSLEGDDEGDVRALRFLDRVAKVYQHPNGGYLHDDRKLGFIASDFGIDVESFQRCDVAPILTHAHARETWQALDTLCQSLGITTTHAAQVTLDQKGLIDAILDAAVKVRKKAPTERRLKKEAQKINPSARVSFSAFDPKKHALVPRCDDPAASLIERPACGAAAYLGDETGADEEERERRQTPPPQGEG